MNELSYHFGGFEGNAQSFRIVARLASRSRDYTGLDLTRATLAATLKYPWYRGENVEKPKKWGAYRSENLAFEFASLLFAAALARTVEAAIMDWADDVTYSVHDIEDFYRANRLPLHLLANSNDSKERESFYKSVFERRNDDGDFKNQQLFREAFYDVLVSSFSIPIAYNGSSHHRGALRTFTGLLIGRYINAATLVEKSGVIALDINPDYQAEVAMLKELTWTYVIEASSLAAQQHGQKRIIRELFGIYRDSAASRKSWNIFPTFYRERFEEVRGEEAEAHRTCVDMIASMTERQAVAMHHRLTGQSHGSGLDDILS